MSMEGDSKANTMKSECSKKPKTYNPRSIVWQHFTKYSDEDGKQRARCNYCNSNYGCESKGAGTTNLKNHIPKCMGNPANDSSGQSHLAFTTEKDQETGDTKVCLQSFRFDQKKGKRAIAEMIIIDELPFKFVENEGFRRLMRICQPALVVPSRSTIRRECYKIYLDEKIKLKAQMKKSVHRVCLTTDTWTSLQRINYMCLTAHYVDENWNLQKKVINFCPISSHRGNDIGRAVENCLIDWELQNIMTVTVDNASSNDVAIEYLVGKMVKLSDKCILKGKWTHVRCIAHIMNLVVQDGLKEVGKSVDRIRAAVKFVRQSPARLKRFKDFALLEAIACEKSLILDVTTRWNSTYLMLNVASEYRKAFEAYIEEDRVFYRELVDGHGVPDSNDWDNTKRLGGFLRHFYELTLRVSGTKYITSNTYLDSIYCVDAVLKQCHLSDDEKLKNMAKSTTLKFKKYWGDVKKFNLLVFVASLFDPRTKLAYLKVNLRGIYGIEVGDQVCKMCEEALVNIFNDYKRIHSNSHPTKASSTSSKTTNVGTSGSEDFNLFGSIDDTFRALREKNMAEVKRQKIESGVAEDSKTELDRYLNDEIEGDSVWFESEDFTVLGWWKKRSPAFPVLSLIACDILAIPISTVASESTFSTGGRVLDTFRSSLTPQIVEALICCQDWLRPSGVPVNVEENIEDLDKFDEDMKKESSEIGDTIGDKVHEEHFGYFIRWLRPDGFLELLGLLDFWKLEHLRG